ncbi:MAG TPA: hypothetical protein VMF14_18420 [Solirubrobacteraceae bacterium]|nr:hypothetical protein [Solirubrobacteraceae bacterium]
MPQRKSTKSRKRRSRAGAPRAVASTRRDERAERQAQTKQEVRRGGRVLGREGERPEGPFGGLPISELAILLGLIAAVIGFIQHGGPALIVGLIVCALGVIEITAREHFSGYRSHASLLAAIPSVAAEVGIVLAFKPSQRALLVLVVVPIFGGLFWWLRKRFLIARQARVARLHARPPAS